MKFKRMTATIVSIAVACVGLLAADPAAAGAGAERRSGVSSAGRSAASDGFDAEYAITLGGDLVVAEMSSPGTDIRLGADLATGFVYGLRIDEATGPVVVTVVDGDGATVVVDNSESLDRVVTFAVPADGAYTIILDPGDVEAGSWRCELYAGVATPRIDLPVSAAGWYSQTSLDVSWSAASTEPVIGYAVVLDDDPATEPSEMTTDVDHAVLEVPEGESWLHVRGVLADGSLGRTAHSRIMVDTVPPVLGALSSVSHPDQGAVYEERTVELAWVEPSDASGIAGYSIDASRSPSSLPDATVDTSDIGYSFALDADGLWYLRVCAVDNAGNLGEPQVYEVNVDADAPASPLVTGTHEDGVESTRRTLVAQFASGDDEPVSGWTAVVDQDPGTVPDPATAHTEPRLVTTLEPGTWWLHVSAGDELGRWSEPTHLEIVVTSMDVAVLQPADSWVWASTSIPITCEAGVTDDTLATIGLDETVTIIGPVTQVDDACTVTWDPRTALTGGERTWPDGAYDLVVLDASGAEVSDLVPVTVAVTSTAVDRAISEYEAGILTAEELVGLLVDMLTNPASVPARYLEGADDGGLTTPIILQSLNLLDPGLRAAFVVALTPKQAAPVPSLRSPTESPAPLAQAVPDCITLDGSAPGCVLNVPGFTISYSPEVVGVPDDYQGVPPRVQTVRDALLYAQETYDDMGFATPSRTITVNLVGGPFLHAGVGVSLPTGVINMNVTDGVQYYLPMHEYFHQVQYQYFNSWDTSSEPYWWMEATAEWAAHRAQENPDFPGDPSSAYAANLENFLSLTSGLHVAQSGVLSSGGAEYGAFVLPEYLAERFGGDEAIRWIWDRIGDGAFGIRPLDAIDDYVQTQQSTYAQTIRQFRIWNYVLGWNGSIGYSDPDAERGGVWRAWLAGGDSFRRVTATAVIDPVTGEASGSVRASASNSAYIEIEKPASVGGSTVLTVTRHPSPHGNSGIADVRATAVPIAEYPTLCADAQELSIPDPGPVVSRTSIDTPVSPTSVEGGDVLKGSFQIAAGCSTITLVITNTSKGSAVMDLDWSVTFSPASTVLSNGTVQLGITRSSMIGADGVGVRRVGDASTEVLATWNTWAVMDGGLPGWVNPNNVVPEGYLRPTGFTTNGRSAVVGASLFDYVGGTTRKGLDIQFNYRPSGSPSLYAIDVQIERTAMNPNSGAVLFQTSMDFDIPPETASERVIWNSATGQAPALVEYGHGVSSGNPIAPLSQPAELGVWSGPADLGTEVRLNLGELAVGERATFTLYVGVATSSLNAAAAVGAVDPVLYALVEPGAGADTPGGVIGVFGLSELQRIPATPAPGQGPL